MYMYLLISISFNVYRVANIFIYFEEVSSLTIAINSKTETFSNKSELRFLCHEKALFLMSRCAESGSGSFYGIYLSTTLVVVNKEMKLRSSVPTSFSHLYL